MSLLDGLAKARVRAAGQGTPEDSIGIGSKAQSLSFFPVGVGGTCWPKFSTVGRAAPLALVTPPGQPAELRLGGLFLFMTGKGAGSKARKGKEASQCQTRRKQCW